MLFDINLFKKLVFPSKLQVRSEGTFSGLFLGLALGIIWIPCIGPVLSGVLALVATQGKMASGAFLLAVYSIGFSIPILIAGYGSHFFRRKISVVQKHPLLIRFFSGGLLIAFGIYIFKQGLLSFGW
jgi:cytochrome c-type biogenesis protein